MGRKSSISRLPADIKTYIEAMLATGSQTLDQLIADLQARFPAAASSGDLPSRSAMHRYGNKLDRRLAAIKASTQAAIMIREHAGDSQDARSEALTALVQTELFEALLSLQEAEDTDLDPGERIAMLSAAAKNIATLTRSSVNLKKFQSEVEEATRKKIMDEQRTKLEAMGSKGGVTEDTKKAIREALGIA
jgi:DNA-binding ferritin-like protein